MRGHDNKAKPNRDSEGFSSILWWIGRNRLPANNGQREYRIAFDIYSYDGGTRIDKYYFSSPEFAYRLTVATASIAGFSLGIGQCITTLIGG